MPRVWLAPQAVRELQLVVRYRQQLVDARRAVKLRIGAVLRQQRVHLAGGRWSRKWCAALLTSKALSEQGQWLVGRQLGQLQRLSAEIAEVERHLAVLAGDDWLVCWLTSIKGVGLVTACILRAEIGSFARFRTAKQLARYCALTPRNASSGTRQADAGLIYAGNLLLRRTLIELAHRLARWEPRWHELAMRLRARGKHGSLAAAAVANRWVRSIHAAGVRLEQAA